MLHDWRVTSAEQQVTQRHETGVVRMSDGNARKVPITIE